MQVGDAVRAALAALGARLASGDALVILVGDHGTPLNGSAHSSDPVPLFMYGTGSRSAAARALGLQELTGATVMHQPVLPAASFPLLFPFGVACQAPTNFSMVMSAWTHHARTSDSTVIVVLAVATALALSVSMVATISTAGSRSKRE